MDTHPTYSLPSPWDQADGEAAARRAMRREKRIALLDVVLDANVAAVQQLVSHIKAELPPEQSAPFAGLADPCLALERLTRAIGRLVALQEKLDEDDETRAARLKTEREARKKAEQEARDRDEAREAEDVIEVRKQAVRRALSVAYKAYDPDTDFDSREYEIDKMLEEYEVYEDYEHPPEAIIAKICRDHGLEYEPEEDEDDSDEDEDRDDAVSSDDADIGPPLPNPWIGSEAGSPVSRGRLDGGDGRAETRPRSNGRAPP